MSIDTTEGLQKIRTALDALGDTYQVLAKLQSRPVPADGVDEDFISFPLSRAEARLVLDSRISKLKDELKRLGFTKPIVQVQAGETNATKASQNALAAEVEAR